MSDGVDILGGDTPSLQRVTTVGSSTTTTVQLQGGLDIQDSTGANTINITNNGTDLLTTVSDLSDRPRNLSYLPYHVVLEGTNAPLDIAGVYPDGLLYARWSYDQSTSDTGSVQAYGVLTDLEWNSSDALTGFTAGITGFKASISALQSLGTIAIPILQGGDFTINGVYDSASANAWLLRGLLINFAGTHTAALQAVSGIDVLFDSLTLEASASSTSSGIVGVRVRMPVQSAGVGNDFYGFKLESRGATTGGGVITNDYGLYVADNSHATNSYALWLDGAGSAYFRNSNTKIGSSVDGVLSVASLTSVDIDSPTLNATDMQAERMALQGASLSSTAPLVIDGSSSTYQASMLASLTHTGGLTPIGSFQSVTVYDGSHLTPTSYGFLVESTIDDNTTTSFALANLTGGKAISGFASNGTVMSGGAYAFIGLETRVLPTDRVGGSHTGSPAVYAIGLDIPAINQPTGTGSFYKSGIRSAEAIDMFPDVSLSFNASAVANGDTRVYYDSSTSELRHDVDGVQVAAATAASVEFNVPVKSVNPGITVYDATSGTSFSSSAIVVPLDTTLTNTNATYFSVASSEITIKQAGYYQVSYKVSTEVLSGSSRSGTQTQLELDPATGTYAAVAGADGYIYNRTAGAGSASASETCILNIVAANSKLRLRAQRAYGTSTLQTIQNGSSLTVMRLGEY